MESALSPPMCFAIIRAPHAMGQLAFWLICVSLSLRCRPFLFIQCVVNVNKNTVGYCASLLVIAVAVVIVSYYYIYYIFVKTIRHQHYQ